LLYSIKTELPGHSFQLGLKAEMKLSGLPCWQRVFVVRTSCLSLPLLSSSLTMTSFCDNISSVLSQILFFSEVLATHHLIMKKKQKTKQNKKKTPNKQTNKKTPGCLKTGVNYCKKMNKLQLLHLATACAQKPMPNNGSVSSLVSSFQNIKGVLLTAVGVGNSQKCESTDIFAVPHPLRGRKPCKNWRDMADHSTLHFTEFFPYLFMLSIIVSRKMHEMYLNNI